MMDATPTAGGGHPPDALEKPVGKPCLLWVGSARHSDLGRCVRIERDEAVIGRGEDVDVALQDPGASRRHAKLVRTAGDWVLVDLDSRNGTYVNGLRIRSCPLQEGDRIQIGTVSALRFSFREQLDEGEERMRRALAAAGIGTWEWHVAAGAVTLSGGAERILHQAPGEATPRTFWQTLHPDDAERVRDGLKLAARSGRGCEITCRVLQPDGATRWLEMRGQVFRDETGTPTHITGAVMDVTGRRQVEQELRRYALMFESLNDGVMVVDPHGEIIDWNGSAERMFGWAKAEALGKRPGELLQPGGADALTSTIMAEVARSGRWCEEVALRRKGGGELVAEVIAMPLRDPGGRHLADVVVHRDVTERKQMQARLILSDRMASLGTLSAGMAHEINNPLAFVLGNLVYVDEALSAAGGGGVDTARLRELRIALRDAREGAERIRAIVKDLASFSRGSAPEAVDAVDVNRVLEFALKMAENHLRARARVVKCFAEVPPVSAVESRLCQVFLNLLVNAAQAIADEDASRNEVRVATSHDPASGRIEVEVSDTGKGIPAEDLSRIFDPFFSTRHGTGGTGLGLSICHSIVTSFGGEIAVESKVGEGTRFRVLLPATERRQPQVEVERHAPPPARILVVDDEPLVGSVIQRLLSPPHEVICLTQPKEALSLVTAGARFDLLLCDLVMPEMTGMELYARMEEAAPDQARRMVFMTGGAFTPAARSFVERGKGRRVVTKPLDLPELTAIIEEFAPGRQADGASAAAAGDRGGKVIFPARWNDAAGPR